MLNKVVKAFEKAKKNYLERKRSVDTEQYPEQYTITLSTCVQLPGYTTDVARTWVKVETVECDGEMVEELKPYLYHCLGETWLLTVE